MRDPNTDNSISLAKFLIGFSVTMILNTSFLMPAVADTLFRENSTSKHIEEGKKWYLEGDPETYAQYVGEVESGVPHGQGTLTYPDGRKYVGEWKNGERTGHGTFTFPDGSKHVGEWKDDLPNGQGVEMYADGSKYVGQFKDGNYDGQGTITYANGQKYVGEWKNDSRSGQGTYTWPNGQKYVGEWKNDLRNGQGTLAWSDGGKYVGEFKADKQHGQGTITYANGQKYVGEWKNDSRSGQGTYTWPDGQKYVGEFEKGKRDGHGTFTYSNSSRYIGQFSFGHLWKGTIYSSQGEQMVSVANGEAQAFLGFHNNTKKRKNIGKLCGTDRSILLLNSHLVFPDAEGYLSFRIEKFIESEERVLIVTEDAGLWELYFDQALISESLEGYTRIKLEPCEHNELTLDYFLFETDVIELDNIIWQTGVTCEEEALSACLLFAFQSQDISNNGKLSIAEINRFVRHLVVWAGVTNDGSRAELVGTAATTQLVSPLLTKILILNYDYDNDEHLSLSEISHDFVDLASTTISKEDMREKLKLLDDVQQLRSLDFGNLESLLKLLQ